MISTMPVATPVKILLALLALSGAALATDWDEDSAAQLVGGDEVDISKAKTLVQIEHKCKNGKWAYRCTGFIGQADVIITTSSCVGNASSYKPLDAASLRVRAGSTHSLRGGQLRTVTLVQLHPKWHAKRPKEHVEVIMNTFDVAAVFLTAPLALNGVIRRAILAPVGTPPKAETRVLAAGFSLASDTDSSQLTLRRIEVRVIPNANCRVIVNNLGGDITREQFCVRSGIGKAFCTSDIGAPATRVKDAAVVGLFSWAWSTCGFMPVPSVLTDLTNAEVRQFVDKALAQSHAGSNRSTPRRKAGTVAAGTRS